MAEKNKEKNNSFLNEFKYRVGYEINEEARYKKLEMDENEYDNIPDNVYMTKDGMPTPNIPTHMEEDVDEPTPAEEPPEGPPGDEPTPEEVLADVPEEEEVEEERAVDEIQNEIIKHNIEAMKAIHNSIKSLDDTVNQLNSKVDGLSSDVNNLSSDVEEVREPTDAEKLVKQKDVSYPYYFNLSDYWKGNWFDQKRQDQQQQAGKTKRDDGIVELPDGSFIASFDDLPKLSDDDLKKTFDKLI